MMKSFKFIPVILVILSMIIFSIIIVRHESHLQQSQSIYIQLEPVDPRSLLQGDYMQLGYDLKFSVHETLDTALIRNQKQVMARVELDEKRRVIQTHLKVNDQKYAHLPLLKLKNPNNHINALYPAANSFMFAEGLATCYDQAAYAEIRVRPNGEAMLADLLNQELKSLNCEAQKSWKAG